MINKLPHILILTPLKDATNSAATYFENIKSLSYPTELISIGFLESDSRDATYDVWQRKIGEILSYFRRIDLWKKDYFFKIPNGLTRHDHRIQVARRAVLARSRNYLLSRSLQDEEWVLWLDSDVIEYPKDIIQTLLATNKTIVVPNCVRQYGGSSYDLNSWRNIGNSVKHLHDLKIEGELVKIDSVGGTMLLVYADLHREGLIFPPFPYGLEHAKIRHNNYWKGEIETEGFGIMALDMGVQPWAMPSVEIKHSLH